MRFAQSLQIIQVHCQGEIGKVLVGGVPEIPGATMLDRMNHINRVDDSLRRFVTFGGFLLVDASDGSDGDGFDRAVRRELARVLPQSPLEPLSPEHVVFKSFFLLDGAAGRLARKPYLSAARVGDRAAVVYSQNDLLGALARDEAGEYAFDPDPGGEAQREQAVRLAINVCLYALCLDYKDDAVHLPLILNKRR